MDTDCHVGELWNTIDNHLEQITDQNLEATSRILNTAKDIQNIGISTLVELGQQGERLHSIHQREKEMELDLEHSHQLLKSMRCSICWCPSNSLKTYSQVRLYYQCIMSHTAG